METHKSVTSSSHLAALPPYHLTNRTPTNLTAFFRVGGMSREASKLKLNSAWMPTSQNQSTGENTHKSKTSKKESGIYTGFLLVRFLRLYGIPFGSVSCVYTGFLLPTPFRASIREPCGCLLIRPLIYVGESAGESAGCYIPPPQKRSTA